MQLEVASAHAAFAEEALGDRVEGDLVRVRVRVRVTVRVRVRVRANQP